MAFVNIIDGTSETPSASTPGWQLDMRNRTTLSRASLGVPVRMWVCATNTSTGDTGAVLLVDSTGATVLSLQVNGDSTDTWYFVDGYIPATDAKYDVMIGGTTAGTMKVLAVNVGEYTTLGGGILLSSIGEITMTAAGTVADTWTVDATSGKAVPADATEWAAFISANSLSIAVPDYLHLCQESSGNLAGVIGGLTLTANGSPAYGQALSGWTRLGVKGNASTSNQRFYSGSGPNPSTTSVARLAIIGFDNPPDGTTREMFSCGANSDISIQGVRVSSVNYIRYRESGNISDTSGSSTYSTAHPVGFVNDRTGVRARLYTDQEKLSPTHGDGLNSPSYTIGAVGGTWQAVVIGYDIGWSGSNAEISDANYKALLQAMGYTISWS